MRFSVHDYRGDAWTAEEPAVVYDVARGEARFGTARADGHTLVWSFDGSGDDALISEDVELDPALAWLVRCDRVDFPPGGVAYRHTHPGPGIRVLLAGEIRIDTGSRSATHGPFGAWFESGPEPVFAAASAKEDTAFVRVMLLPREWEGKRTIRYVEPADAERPKTQRVTVLLERHVELP